MSTTCTIGCQINDKQVKLISCHWDGYPEYVGNVLLNHYTNIEKINKLLDLGNISSLDKEVAPPKNTKHTFAKPVSGVTVAYMRDRGEIDNDQEATVCDLKDLNNILSEYGAEYNYLFKNNTWHMVVSKSKLIFQKM